MDNNYVRYSFDYKSISARPLFKTVTFLSGIVDLKEITPPSRHMSV